MSDKLFSQVQLLCGFNGADAATSFTDESSAARVATFVGNAQLDTAQKRFGASSALFDGTGDVITFPDSGSLSLGPGPFCIEAWVRFATAPGDLVAQPDGMTFASHYSAVGNQRSWLFRYLNGTLDFRFNPDGTTLPNHVVSIPWTPIADRWYFVKADRLGDDIRLTIDNAVSAPQSIPVGIAPFETTSLLRIGAYETTGSVIAGNMNGWIDEVRLTVGVSRHTSAWRSPRGPWSRDKAMGVLGEFSQSAITSRTGQDLVPRFEHILRIPAGTVGSDLTNFPVYVPLEDLPEEFWSSVRYDGGDIRVVNSSDAIVPIDLVTFDRPDRKGTLFFKAGSISSASDTEFILSCGDHSLTSLAFDDVNGRNNVWSDYEVVYLFVADLVDRTGNHDLLITTGKPRYTPVVLGCGGGLDVSANLQLQALNQLAGGTSITIAGSMTVSEIASSNRLPVAFQETFLDNAGRMGIGARQSTARWTNWDNSNSWNDGSLVSLNVPVRLHGVWNGSTEKRCYVNGALQGTDITVVGIGTSNDSITVGEGGADSSFHRGHIGFVYLRRQVLSPDWIAAEYFNLNNPAGFFGAAVESLWLGALT